jgi:hypothetical protein
MRIQRPRENTPMQSILKKFLTDDNTQLQVSNDHYSEYQYKKKYFNPLVPKFRSQFLPLKSSNTCIFSIFREKKLKLLNGVFSILQLSRNFTYINVVLPTGYTANKEHILLWQLPSNFERLNKNKILSSVPQGLFFHACHMPSLLHPHLFDQF